MNATHPLAGQPLLKTKSNTIISDLINQRIHPPAFETNIDIILYDNKTHEAIKSATYFLDFSNAITGGITIGNESRGSRMEIVPAPNSTSTIQGGGGSSSNFTGNNNSTGNAGGNSSNTGNGNSSDGVSTGSLISGLFHTKGDVLNLVIIHNSSLLSTVILGDLGRSPLALSQGTAGQGSFVILTPALQQNQIYRLHVIVVGAYSESCILDAKQQLSADFIFLAGSNAQGKVPRALQSDSMK